MSRIADFLRSLGVAGATRNAGLLLDQRREERLAVAALRAAAPAKASTRRDARSLA
jgi:hypothetical protein